jgi:hypothetical protein
MTARALIPAQRIFIAVPAGCPILRLRRRAPVKVGVFQVVLPALLSYPALRI